MTDAINYFQAILTQHGFSSIGANRSEIRLANALKKDARKLASEANEEAQNAQTAKKIAFDAQENKTSENFAEIALWHSLIAFGKYRQASQRFNEAAKIETKKQREFAKNAKLMAERATEAEISVSLLTEFLNEN